MSTNGVDAPSLKLACPLRLGTRMPRISTVEPSEILLQGCFYGGFGPAYWVHSPLLPFEEGHRPYLLLKNGKKRTDFIADTGKGPARGPFVFKGALVGTVIC